MQIRWDITPEDVAKVNLFLETYRDNAFVKNRIQKNVRGPKQPFSRESFWHQMVACLLTSQQKSGPASAVSRMIHKEPFPLDYRACASCAQSEALVRDVLSDFGGIRRYDTIAVEVAQNLRRLEDGLWLKVEQTWARLMMADDSRTEREAARVIDAELKGFGPKQARNLLQGLGLTKYEIPLDSRIGKKLRDFDFPVDIPSQALFYSEIYELVLDGVQELCRRCEVFPCVLDASMFASFDGEGWNGMKIIW